MKTVLAVCIAAWLTGCTTVHFDNGPVSATAETTTVHQWHHSFAYEFYEGSAPIDPSDVCTQGWESISYDNTLIPWLATGTLLYFTGPGALSNGLWSPRRVSIQCSGEG